MIARVRLQGVISVEALDGVATARLEDAKILLAANRLDCAHYLCGYAVELALKARIYRVLDWQEFPGSRREFEGYRSFRTHDLGILLRLSGQESRIKKDHFDSWNVASFWTAELRYNVIGTSRCSEVQAMIEATESLMGIL